MFLAPEIEYTQQSRTLADGEPGIFQTIATMRALVDAAKKSPVIRQAAINTIFMHPAQYDCAEVIALFEMVRDNVRYTKDINGVETLATPEKTLAMRIGDCDDLSVLLAALLESVGYPTRFVIDSYDGEQWSHVYLCAYCEGQWIALDPTEQVPAGWMPPDALARWME